MRNVLLTGFEPFNNDTVNPSWDAVLELDGWRNETVQIVAALLPCVFDEAAEKLELAIQQTRPAAVICVGLAAGRSTLSLERIAINLDDAPVNDNVGFQPIERRIIADAPDAYFTGLPVKALLLALQRAGIPASLSYSAGTFVCNHVFFRLMHEIATRRPGIKGGFVHVPASPEFAEAYPGMPVLATDQVIKGLKLIVDLTLSLDAEPNIPGGFIA